MLTVTPAEMTQLVADFDAHLTRERQRSPLTAKRYRGVLRAFAGWLEKENGPVPTPLEAASKADLLRFLTTQHEVASKATWNAETAALRSFFAWLYANERIAANPALRIDRVRAPAKEAQPLTFDELIRLITAVEEHSSPVYQARNLALLHVAFHSALRVSELVSLDVDQVDLENRVFRNVRTKGDRRLSALFNDVVAESLEHWLAARATLAPPDTEHALFLSDRRHRLSVRAVQQFLEVYGKLAGIGRPVTPHLLRHSSATQLSELGVPLRVIQEHCGHASVTTTERYVHASSGARRRAVDGLGASFTARAGSRHLSEDAKKPAESGQKGSQNMNNALNSMT